MEDHVQDVIGLMDHLEIKKANILGASMGSYVAQGVAIAVPERVEKLILVVAKAFGKTSSSASS
ncbi:alpha/beta fold hydrolase [Fictibacillus sp. NRS-1165]|uniref:alpha/beta fold hydrolase n=1 Tax=Fictibacillus sp. NRS-1165 TaxID=3144463 RepID=UPI003D2246B1